MRAKTKRWTPEPLTRRRWTPEMARLALAQCRAARTELQERRRRWRSFCDEYERMVPVEQEAVRVDLDLVEVRRNDFDNI